MTMNSKSHPVSCRRCKDTHIVVEPGENLFSVAKLCHCFKNPCPTCNGARFVFHLDEKGREIASLCPKCETIKRNIKLYNSARVPNNYVYSKLEDKDKDEHNLTIFHLLNTILKLPSRGQGREASLVIPDSSDSKWGLVVMGKPGTGKTHLMTGFIYKATLEYGFSCLFQDFTALLSSLKDGYSQGKSDLEIIAPHLSVDFLVIDEMGKGRNTEWELSILDTLISTRYNSNKPILVTSNYTNTKETTLQERVQSRDRNHDDRVLAETLSERVGKRIFSRLQEMCYFETLKGEDRRLQRTEMDFR